jgi:nitrogen fixation NifU-like protein
MDFKDGTEMEDELDRALLQELEEGISPIAVDHALRPRNVGALEDPDGEATLTGICEDTVRIQFKLNQGRIKEIRFMTNGCGATLACGSMATEMARGRTLKEALQIDGRQLNERLGGLPIVHTHCADLVANTLRAAVRDALEKQRSPWKRMYRTPKGHL